MTFLCDVWGRDSTRMHYGEKASQQRQCDALDKVLPRNLVFWHSCGCGFRPSKTAADQVHLFMAMVIFLNGNGYFQQDVVRCHAAKIVQE